jgi:phosphoribosylformimino-5-aminoimidazole carboxamide ribotide isomerase
MRLIPAIDLRDGRCVRLLQGRFDAETVYATDPLEILGRYGALGARYVHVVDLDGARGGTQANLDAIAALATAGRIKLQVGGGVRNRAALTRLLELGVARCVIGSLAVSEPETIDAWLKELGPEPILLAFDVRVDENGTPRLATHGWERQTEVCLWDALERYLPQGLRHVLCTDVGRDGALSGPNVGLYAEALRRFPTIRWQASGGVRDTRDLQSLQETGVAAVISGRALLEDRMSAEELQPFLQND